MACTDSALTTIVQAGLSVGQLVYLSASLTYTPAIATSLATSQVVGMIAAVAPGVNTYILQSSGYNVGALNTDDLGNPIIASRVYYLSTTDAGKVSLTNPTSTGLISKPVYISEQVIGTTGVNAGYILPQRPFDYSSITGYANAYAMALLFGR